MTTVQYRVIVGKGDERIDGPDDAELVVTVPLADAADADFDPVVAFMQGRLKSTGSTGALFTLLRDGAVAAATRFTVTGISIALLTPALKLPLGVASSRHGATGVAAHTASGLRTPGAAGSSMAPKESWVAITSLAKVFA